MQQDLYTKQLALEALQVSMGEARFNRETQSAMSSDREASTRYGSIMMKQAVPPMAEAIDTFLAEANSGKAGRRAVAARYLNQIPPKVAAFITAKTILNSYTREVTLTSLALEIAKSIEDELRFEAFMKKAPAMWHKVDRQTQRSSDRHRRIVLRHTYEKHIAHWSNWPPSMCLHLGTKLIELFAKVTGFVEVVMVQPSKSKARNVLRPTPSAMEWVKRRTDASTFASPTYLPMIVPPEPWTGPRFGGYLTPGRRPVPFIKTSNRSYLQEIEEMPDQMAPIYEAVNIIQEVPFRVNRKVLDTVLELWEGGGGIDVLPPASPLPVPPYPYPEIDKAHLTEAQATVVREWKKEASVLHEYNAKVYAKRSSAASFLTGALKFKDYEEFYFPHQLCFRGRVYPIPIGWSPQGSDLAKSLMEFKRGLPMGDKAGGKWLAIHGANTWGEDSGSLSSRENWTLAHSHRILSSAASPTEDLWWTDADDPWGFLAFCFEWAGYQRDGANHITHLPIAQDGSCSGLQHLSATLRDQVGGKAVNLVPQDQPADIYQEVIDLAIRTIRNKISEGLLGTTAARALDFGLTRKTAKHPTMTVPYGSSKFTCLRFVRKWLTEETEKLEKAGQQNPLEGRSSEAATLISDHVWEAIDGTLVASREAMAWLRDVATIVAEHGLPIRWTTADGFPVLQDYRSRGTQRLKTRFGEQFIYATLREKQEGTDPKRQTIAFPSNWTQAQDGTHLRMAVLAAYARGLKDFAVIHDSFGTHACNTGTLRQCLRDTFVELYRGDNLERLREEVLSYLPPDTTLPPVPSMGTLNIEAMAGSQYMFN